MPLAVLQAVLWLWWPLSGFCSTSAARRPEPRPRRAAGETTRRSPSTCMPPTIQAIIIKTRPPIKVSRAPWPCLPSPTLRPPPPLPLPLRPMDDHRNRTIAVGGFLGPVPMVAQVATIETTTLINRVNSTTTAATTAVVARVNRTTGTTIVITVGRLAPPTTTKRPCSTTITTMSRIITTVLKSLLVPSAQLLPLVI